MTRLITGTHRTQLNVKYAFPLYCLYNQKLFDLVECIEFDFVEKVRDYKSLTHLVLVQLLYHAAGGNDDEPCDIPPSPKPAVLQKPALEFLGWVRSGTPKPTRRIHPPAFEGEEDEEKTQIWGNKMRDDPAPQPEAETAKSSDEPPQGDEGLIFDSEEDGEELEDELEEEEEEEELTLVELRKARTAARVIEEPGVIREEEQAPGRSIPTSPIIQPQGGGEASDQGEAIPVQGQFGKIDTTTSSQLPESGLTPEDSTQRIDVGLTSQQYEVLQTLGLYNPEAP